MLFKEQQVSGQYCSLRHIGQLRGPVMAWKCCTCTASVLEQTDAKGH